MGLEHHNVFQWDRAAAAAAWRSVCLYPYLWIELYRDISDWPRNVYRLDTLESDTVKFEIDLQSRDFKSFVKDLEALVKWTS